MQVQIIKTISCEIKWVWLSDAGFDVARKVNNRLVVSDRIKMQALDSVIVILQYKQIHASSSFGGD